MNLTINSSSTWKNPRNRTIIAVSGIALALSVAIGGFSSLPSSGSREASVTPNVQSRPSTLFGTEADAVYASQNSLTITTQFANSVDAFDASVAAAFEEVERSLTGARAEHFGLGQPGERSSSVDLAAVAAAEIAAFGVPLSDLVTTESVTHNEAVGLGQPGERSSSVDLAAVAAAEIAAFGVPISDLVTTEPVTHNEALGLGQPGERSSSVDLAAVAASELMAYGVYDAQPVITSITPDDALGLGQPGERSASTNDLANIAAGEAMAYGVYDSQPVLTSLTPDEVFGLEQTGERSA
ncbi:MAG TPA: hypothetical protein VG845_06640 [Dehalococcoidia bacterium]|nr:hypothetical protein [Dehalococcoidia bacterium]